MRHLKKRTLEIFSTNKPDAESNWLQVRLGEYCVPIDVIERRFHIDEKAFVASTPFVLI